MCAPCFCLSTSLAEVASGSLIPHPSRVITNAGLCGDQEKWVTRREFTVAPNVLGTHSVCVCVFVFPCDLCYQDVSSFFSTLSR